MWALEQPFPGGVLNLILFLCGGRKIHGLRLSTLPFTTAMAKNKGKRSSGENVASPDGGVSLNDSNSGAASLPNLGEGAFAGLRQKIEQKLKNESAPKQKPKGKPKDASNDTPKKAKDSPAKPAPKQESNKNKGKKRDRNGDVIARDEKKAGKNKQPKPASKDDNDTLRQEILALGGTQEDFDLLAGVGSGSEVEDAADSSKSKKKSDDDSLRKELSSMLAAAGQAVPEDLNGEEEVEDNAEEGEDGEEESEDGDQDGERGGNMEANISDVEEETPPVPSPEPVKEKPKKAALKEPARVEPETILPKAYSKLVSAF